MRAGWLSMVAGVVAVAAAPAAVSAEPGKLPRELDAKAEQGLQVLWSRAGAVLARPDGGSLAAAEARTAGELPLQVVGGTLDLPRVLLRTAQARVLVYLGPDALATVARAGALLVAGAPVPAQPSWSTPGVRIRAGRPVEVVGAARDGVVEVRFADQAGAIEAAGVMAADALGLLYQLEAPLPRAAVGGTARIAEGAEILDVQGRRIAKVLREGVVKSHDKQRRGELLIQLDGDDFSVVGWVKQESISFSLRGRRSMVPRVTIGYAVAGTRMVLPRGTLLYGEIGGAPIGVVDQDFQAVIQRGPGAGWHRYKVGTPIGLLWLWARVPVAAATARP